jgi:hypothetical protein
MGYLPLMISPIVVPLPGATLKIRYGPLSLGYQHLLNQRKRELYPRCFLPVAHGRRQVAREKHPRQYLPARADRMRVITNLKFVV